MCWNAEVSLESFSFGVIGIILASLTGLPFPFILFYATIVGMQLVEFVVWEYGLGGTEESRDINHYASLAASGLLMLQPIASLLTLRNSGPLIVIYLVLGGIFHLMEKSQYSMTVGKDGHLVWEWIQAKRLLFGLAIYFSFLLLPLIIGKSWEYLTIVLVTLGISLVAYGKGGTWGSMWCWIVNWMVVAVCARWAIIHW